MRPAGTGVFYDMRVPGPDNYLAAGLWHHNSGKTWTASHLLSEWIMLDPEPGEWGVVAPTYQDAWSICIEGESGLLAAFGTTYQEVRAGQSELVEYWHRSFAQMRLRSGHLVYVASAQDGALHVQGKNLKGLWGDEAGLWDNWETTWNESIRYAVRKAVARIIVTGTPKQSRRARALVRLLLNDPAVPVTRLRTIDNAANLSEAFIAEVVGKSKGTRLERQELEGEFLNEVDGALWTAEVIDAARVSTAPELTRVVVAIDPAVTSGTDSDETGIIVAGDAGNGHGYVIADYSMRGSPDACMKKAVWAYREHKADRVVAEANNGADYIGSLLRTVDPDIPYRKVTATRGKAVRAEPVSALYEQCVALGTPVATVDGPVPVEAVRPGDLVWTRNGLCRVTWSGCTGFRPTVIVETGDGRRLVCTTDHPVWVTGRGFVHAGLLVPSDILLTCQNTPAPIAAPESPGRASAASPAPRESAGSRASRSGPTSHSRASGITSRRTATTGPAATPATNFFTGQSGQQSTGRYRTAGTSITSTLITATMTRQTSSRSPSAITSRASTGIMSTSMPPRSSSGCGRPDWSGGPDGNPGYTSARNAGTSTSPWLPEYGSARQPAIRPTGIVSVQPGPSVPLYDLTVEGAHEFFASGILVHNCRIHHVGNFPDLEDQLCTWVPTDPASPDRLDACVWAFTELRGLSMGDWHEAYGTRTCPSEKCGRGFIKNNADGTPRTECPHCRTPLDQDEPDTPEESAV